MINVIIIGIYLILTLTGMVLIKLGSQKEFLISITTGVFSLIMSLLFILGIVTYLCSFLMYMLILSKFEMGYIVPVTTGIVTAASFIIGVSIFKESLTISKTVATVLILIGVVIMNIKK